MEKRKVNLNHFAVYRFKALGMFQEQSRRNGTHKPKVYLYGILWRNKTIFCYQVDDYLTPKSVQK
jgi:hypothetical protein